MESSWRRPRKSCGPPALAHEQRCRLRAILPSQEYGITHRAGVGGRGTVVTGVGPRRWCLSPNSPVLRLTAPGPHGTILEQTGDSPSVTLTYTPGNAHPRVPRWGCVMIVPAVRDAPGLTSSGSRQHSDSGKFCPRTNKRNTERL